jgi:hypothetical protein
MSPPIRDGSGNDIGAIRLGDGSEISEVRTGAGDVLFSAIPSTVVAQSDLVAWFPFENSASDETAGDSTYGDTTDYSGAVSGATELSSNGVTDILTQSTDSGCFEFQADSDKIDLGIQQNNVTIQNPHTSMGWVNYDTVTGDARLSSSLLGCRNSEYAIGVNGSNNFAAAVFDGSGFFIDSGVSATTGTWFHLCYRQTSSGQEILINGALENSNSQNVSPRSKTNKIEVGHDEAGANPEFDGRVDDIRFYDRVLTDSEVNEIYQNTEP